jgi:polar amino acid transport system substrate-binding protein
MTQGNVMFDKQNNNTVIRWRNFVIKYFLFASLIFIYCAPYVAAAQPLSFSNLRPRLEVPVDETIKTLRFVVADDFAPFTFVDGTGVLNGIHIDLARSICQKLEIACTIQAVRFSSASTLLLNDQADIVIAGLPDKADYAEDFAFSDPYFRFAARLVARKSEARELQNITQLPEGRIGVVSQTKHEAFARDYFTDSTIIGFENDLETRQALKQGRIDYIFADGLDLAFWLASERSEDCCHWIGGPYFDPGTFGNGLMFMMRKDRPEIVNSMNHALARVQSDGTYQDILRRFLPLNPFEGWDDF